MSSFTNDNPQTNVQSNPTSANLTVAPISFGEVGDTDAKFIANGPGDDVPTRFLLKNRYERDRHIYMMGITSPNGFQGAKTAFVQLASPTLLWISDWTVARFNKKPRIPSSTLLDPNWVLLDEIPETDAITVGPDGTNPLYSVSGIYVYGCRNPDANVYNNVTFPRPAWLADVFIRTINSSDLEQGLIGLMSLPLVLG